VVDTPGGLQFEEQPHPLAKALGTGLEVHGLGTLKVYSLLEYEMDALGSATARMNVAMGATFTCVGAFVTAMLGYYSITSPTPHVEAIYVGAIIALGATSVMTGIFWIVFMVERGSMVTKIKARSATPVRLEPVGHSAGTPPPEGTSR
jgi:hypothetical protein